MRAYAETRAPASEPLGMRQEPIIAEPPMPEAFRPPGPGKPQRRWDALIRRLPRDRPIVGAEVGVHKGEMSHALLSSLPNLTLHMVDRWTVYPPEERMGRTEGMINAPAERWAEYETIARAAVRGFGERAVIHKGNSVDTARRFPARFFNFVFIDAGHHRKAVDADIQAWQAHMKPLGWLCGHDYDPERFPGVVKSVQSRFADDFQADSVNTWFHRLQPPRYYRKKFKEVLGRDPDLISPATQSEFIMRKMLTEDTDLMARTADKIAVRDYARDQIGEKHILSLLYRGGVPEKMPEPGCAVKVNNAAGRNIFILRGRLLRYAGRPAGWPEVKAILAGWLKKTWLTGGLHYYRIKPEILVEPLVSEDVLEVHKVHIWRGEPRYIHCTLYDIGDGLLKIRGITWYDMDWRPLAMINRGHPNMEFRRPECFGELMEATRVLAAPFDHVRVDWFVKGKDFWINELTHCPGGAEPSVFDPPSWQYEFGKRWIEAGC